MRKRSKIERQVDFYKKHPKLSNFFWYFEYCFARPGLSPFIVAIIFFLLINVFKVAEGKAFLQYPAPLAVFLIGYSVGLWHITRKNKRKKKIAEETERQIELYADAFGW